jgi:hypothetical protein
MEIFLHLWDELDDLAGACRHVATSAAIEAAALSRPLVTVASSCVVWILSLKILF